jgi:ribosomal protein S18 acetylase RimI-like enzyme
VAGYIIRPISHEDHDWVRSAIIRSWEAEFVVAHGQIYHPADLPGFAAFEYQKPVGLITYRLDEIACEVITIDSWKERKGIGSALLQQVIKTAKMAGCGRLFLVTTNNNTDAIAFYQKRGMVISKIRINAIIEERKLKPQIPLMDGSGIPITDEIELEILF